MQKVLVWLNLYGREAVRHKLKNNLKTQKTHFLPAFQLFQNLGKEAVRTNMHTTVVDTMDNCSSISIVLVLLQ